MEEHMENIKNSIKAATDFINSSIFSLSKPVATQPSKPFPNMSDEAFDLMKSIEAHVLSCGQKFSIEPAGVHSCRAILVAESSDTAFFWRIESDLTPRFYFLKKSKIKRCFHAKQYMELYLEKFDALPPDPELEIGQDWEFEPHAGGHWLTCLTPRIAGNIVYSELLEKFQRLYSLRLQGMSKAKSGKGGKSDGEGSSAFAGLKLKPSAPAGGSHDFNE
jgi:hypothetical protein